MKFKQGTIIVKDLDEAKSCGLAFLEKCEKGGILNDFTKNGKIIGYKAIPKTDKFISGETINQIFIYKTKTTVS